MAIEVELKFRLADRQALERQVAEFVEHSDEPIRQVDVYYAHPARDFARTDEALRIRRVGDDNYITYKGAKLDSQTKTRREIEVPLASGAAAAADTAALLEALGFSRVAGVSKRRSHSTLRWQDHTVAMAIDQVDDLGDFVELEIMAEPAEVARRATRCWRWQTTSAWRAASGVAIWNCSSSHDKPLAASSDVADREAADRILKIRLRLGKLARLCRL